MSKMDDSWIEKIWTWADKNNISDLEDCQEAKKNY